MLFVSSMCLPFENSSIEEIDGKTYFALLGGVYSSARTVRSVETGILTSLFDDFR